MELTFLIPSRVRRQVLEYWVENPGGEVYAHGLARTLKESPQLVYRELINLENWGLLFSRALGRQRMFRLNKKFPLYPPVCELFRRVSEENNRELNVVKVYDLKQQVRKLSAIATPKELNCDLRAQRTKPRAYAEEKILRKQANDN